MGPFVSTLGFLAGVAGAIALLLNNPMKSSQVGITDAQAAYSWQSLEFHGAAINPVRLLNLPGVQHTGVLAGDAIEAANVAVIVVRDPAGQPAALGTRIEYQDKHPDLTRSNVGVASFTSMMWPNYGSLLLHGYENRWPLVRSWSLLSTE